MKGYETGRLSVQKQQRLKLIVATILVLFAGCRSETTDVAPSKAVTPENDPPPASDVPSPAAVSPPTDSQPQLTRAVLDASLAVGRQYLLLNQRYEGNFNYEYNFRTGELNPQDSQVRQAGATWGVATIHRDQPSEETHAALAHAIHFFKRHSVRTDDGRRFVVYPGDVHGRTGTVALVSLALIDFITTLPEGAERAEMTVLLNEYMKFLVSLRHTNGENQGHFFGTYDYETGQGHGEPSPYFDGESLLAMTKACRNTGMTELEGPILESAENMYQRYVTEARKVDPDSNLTKGFYQWSTMAFFQIHEAGWSKSDKFAERAIDLAHWMIDVHHTLRRTRNTAYAHEGLVTAWELARQIGKKAARDKFGRVVDEGLTKLTSWQVGGPNPNPWLRQWPTKDLLAIGGIMNSESEPKLRIDVAQHQMHAVLLARRYICQSTGDAEADLSPSGPMSDPSDVSGTLPWKLIGAPLMLESDEAKATMQTVWDAMQTNDPVDLTLSENLQHDDHVRIVFLSVGAESGPANVVIGHGRGLKAALQDAIGKARQLSPIHEARRVLMLDVVQTSGLRELVHPLGALRIAPGQDGIVFHGTKSAAFHPMELLCRGLVNAQNSLRLENVVQYLDGYHGARGDMNANPVVPRMIRPFRTISWFFDGTTFRHLYRGHRIPGTITQESLRESLRIAGRYLTSSVSESGHMIYTYDPTTSEQPDAYNILRHAGTAFSMFDLYRTTKHKELLNAAQRARTYLLEQVWPWPTDGAEAATVAFGTKMKLGGTALAVIMLVSEMQATDDRQYLDVAQKLSRYLELQQRDDGSFISSRNRRDGSERDFVSIYYPGEAILALVRMHSIDGDSRWLDVAEDAARYLIEDRDGQIPAEALPHDHWLLCGLNELHQVRPQQMYLDHSRRIVAAIQSGQRRETLPPDCLGTFNSPPRTTPVATRAEGLLAAYRLFEKHGTREESQQVLEMIHMAVNFQLQTQSRAESSMFFDQPQRAIGAFHSGLTDFEIRNDYVQHNITALLELYRFMQREKIEELGEEDWESTQLIRHTHQLMRRSTNTLKDHSPVERQPMSAF